MADAMATASWKLLADRQVASVRQTGGGDGAQRAVRDLGLPWPARPMQAVGDASCMLAWQGPQETIAVTRGREALQGLLHRLAAGSEECAVAVDLSEALAVLELEAPQLDAWLARLVDAGAIPRAPGDASRARLADVAVLLLRLEAQRLWLVAERPLLPYLEEWLAYARAGLLHDADHDKETA